MDVRDLKFDADSFDVAIDKGEKSSECRRCGLTLLLGTMDAMMTAKGDVWVSHMRLVVVFMIL